MRPIVDAYERQLPPCPICLSYSDPYRSANLKTRAELEKDRAEEE